MVYGGSRNFTGGGRVPPPLSPLLSPPPPQQYFHNRYVARAKAISELPQVRFYFYLLHFRRFCKFARDVKNHSKTSKTDPKIAKASSGTFDDCKVRSRGQSSLPKWSPRAVLTPLGCPERSILEHLEPPESVSG